MNQPAQISDEDLVRALQEKIVLVKEAAKQVEEGRVPDVSAMEQDIESLCSRAASCGPEHIKSVRALMAILIDHLETLARRIKETHDVNTTPS